MKICVILYEHKHGHDVALIAAESEKAALKSFRDDLVDEYGEEDIAADESEYGGLSVERCIEDGDAFNCNHKAYRVRFEEA